MRQSAHRGAPPLWEHRFGNPFVIACTTGRTLRPKRNVAISNKENPNYDDVRSANLCLGNNSDLPVRGHAAPGNQSAGVRSAPDGRFTRLCGRHLPLRYDPSAATVGAPQCTEPAARGGVTRAVDGRRAAPHPDGDPESAARGTESAVGRCVQHPLFAAAALQGHPGVPYGQQQAFAPYGQISPFGASPFGQIGISPFGQIGYPLAPQTLIAPQTAFGARPW